jgi:dTDP-glucose pyrophosphorylase
MKDILVSKKISIRQSMKILDKTAEKCLLVIDKNKQLLGTLTDGDIRRSILDGVKVSRDISTSYNSKPKVVYKNKDTLKEAKSLMLNNNLVLIPIIDSKNIVIDYLTLTDIGNETNNKKLLKDIPVVIMAGGKGSRLEPFTKVLPKPLLPINDKPIIEHIIESFTDIGISDFYMTVNYKGKILKAYFDELEPNYKINFVDEEKPLGTAGSLRFLNKKFKKAFFVTNCDIMIKVDYSSLYEFHKKGNYDITLVASAKEFIIQYGNCVLNQDGHLSHIDEKPKYDYLINTGLYVLNPDVLGVIPKNKFFHITHLIEKLKKEDKKIGVFPIDDDAWIDVGEWTEYEKAIEKLK